MTPLTIVPVNNRRQRLRFIKMPWSIYRGDPRWVPSLIAEQKAFLHPRRGVFFDHGQAEMSQIVETNTAMRNSLKHLPVEIYKTYRIFKRAIQERESHG